ncbi:hypothetical protein H109_02577 [Trichophyton interdigitale MR816]|uniref:Uncharacterized protein n=1 Tax=Trichophyton interdigitale (strain MR816) TaxID=1215338 RepID=A0A059JCM7_TRIIM|nr:hypothetical protein H109_02577 [Trichophyton interdigitale MR816]
MQEGGVIERRIGWERAAQRLTPFDPQQIRPSIPGVWRKFLNISLSQFGPLYSVPGRIAVMEAQVRRAISPPMYENMRGPSSATAGDGQPRGLGDMHADCTGYF